jgi:hypothetical protein
MPLVVSERPPPKPIRAEPRSRVRLDPGRGVSPGGEKPPTERGAGAEAEEPRGSGLLGVLAGVVVLGAVVVLYRVLVPADETTPSDAPSASASVAIAVPAPRCVELAPEQSFVVGEAPARSSGVAPSGDPTPGMAPLEPNADAELAPFAVVLGRAVAHEGGYAVGALRDGEGGTIASLVVLDAKAERGSVVRLARSRGDVEPPVVVPQAGGFFVATVEPSGTGRAIRVGRVDGEKVRWGAELPERRDDSLAFDLAVGAARGLVVWDEADDDAAYVAISSFRLDDLGNATAPRRITGKKVDADAPRVVPRAGGFWLAYLVHGEEKRRERAGDRGPGDLRDEGVDEARGGEAVATTWIEVLPLDENGAKSGDPLRVSERDGHVMDFDVRGDAEGRLLVAWRDEDAPTGGGGGAVRLVRVSPGGPEPGKVVAEEGATDGVPGLLDGWITVPTLRGSSLLARLGADGFASEGLEPEPSLGRLEPIAARGSELLVARPDGRAMRLSIVRCGERAPAPPEELP